MKLKRSASHLLSGFIGGLLCFGAVTWNNRLSAMQVQSQIDAGEALLSNAILLGATQSEIKTLDTEGALRRILGVSVPILFGKESVRRWQSGESRGPILHVSRHVGDITVKVVDPASLPSLSKRGRMGVAFTVFCSPTLTKMEDIESIDHREAMEIVKKATKEGNDLN